MVKLKEKGFQFAFVVSIESLPVLRKNLGTVLCVEVGDVLRSVHGTVVLVGSCKHGGD